jgi:3'-phosphoadenosine 5'-phosphosulfate sulfotransferase (PAPS reductase)/FAD synthetase
VFSIRSKQYRWDPKNQRPELWRLYNAYKHRGESIRVFPLSNWTEIDVWLYIYLENIPIVLLYFARERPVVKRDGGSTRRHGAVSWSTSPASTRPTRHRSNRTCASTPPSSLRRRRPTA